MYDCLSLAIVKKKGDCFIIFNDVNVNLLLKKIPFTLMPVVDVVSRDYAGIDYLLYTIIYMY